MPLSLFLLRVGESRERKFASRSDEESEARDEVGEVTLGRIRDLS